jgi:hypothetical protein
MVGDEEEAKIVKHWATGLAAFVCIVVLAALPSNGAASPASSAKTELQTAAFHAGELAQKGTLSATQLHLHHAINCLEGPTGSDFVSSAGNPCQGQGNGVIPDLKAAAAANVPGAKAALDDAMAALKLALQGEGTNDVTQAKALAAQTAQHLNQATSKIGM